MDKDIYTLDEFKYNYYTADKDEQRDLLQSVLMYPGRFTYDVVCYVRYLWNKYYELYDFEIVPYADVVNDVTYKNNRIEVSNYSQIQGFKIKDKITGMELGQGLFDYQKSQNTVTIHYMEFKSYPDEVSVGMLLNNLLMYQYNEDVRIRFV